MNVSCPDAKRCEDGECVNCSAGSDCGCYDDDATANGDGVCEPNIHECDPGKEYNTDTRSCENCAEDADCGCFDQGGYADGNGGCRIICEDWEYWDGSKCVPAVGACETSDDCVSGNYCLDHSCVPGCDSDDDCTDGFCENNKCTSSCRNDDDCSGYKNCYDGKCQTSCDYYQPCTNPKYPKCYDFASTSTDGHKYGWYCDCNSSSCGDGMICDNGYSYRSENHNKADPGYCKEKGGTCTQNSDCPIYNNCINGTCTDPCDPNPCTNPKYPNCQQTASGGPNGEQYGFLCNCSYLSCGSGMDCNSKYSKEYYNKTDPGFCEPIKTTCTKDSDCSGSYENCYDGVCKKPCDDNPCTNSKYPTCSNVWDGGDHYYGYVCKCTSSSCGNMLSYKCETTSSGVSYDTNTPDSRLCKVLQTEQCSTDDDCSAEKECFAGYCIFRNICTKDSDCASTERCSDNGYCVLNNL